MLVSWLRMHAITQSAHPHEYLITIDTCKLPVLNSLRCYLTTDLTNLTNLTSGWSIVVHVYLTVGPTRLSFSYRTLLHFSHYTTTLYSSTLSWRFTLLSFATVSALCVHIDPARLHVKSPTLYSSALQVPALPSVDQPRSSRSPQISHTISGDWWDSRIYLVYITLVRQVCKRSYWVSWFPNIPIAS